MPAGCRPPLTTSLRRSPSPRLCACPAGNPVGWHRHQLSLYAHVSTITWQFERHPQRVAGTVSDPLRAFDFDPLTTSSFDIANALWDLMRDDDDEGGDAAAGSTAAGNN